MYGATAEPGHATLARPVESPLRAELFSLSQLEAHAKALAFEHTCDIEIDVHSGFRAPEHNKRIQRAARDSQHQYGDAALVLDQSGDPFGARGVLEIRVVDDHLGLGGGEILAHRVDFPRATYTATQMISASMICRIERIPCSE